MSEVSIRAFVNAKSLFIMQHLPLIYKLLICIVLVVIVKLLI